MKLRLFFLGLFTLTLILAACSGAKPTTTPKSFPSAIGTSTPQRPTPNPAQIQQAQEHRATGVELREEEKYQEAIAEYDEAIQLNPKYAAAYVDRGAAYFRLGQIERAIEDYDTVIAIDAHYHEAYNNRGLAHARLGRLDLAIEDYTQAILNFLDYAEAYLHRGDAYYQKGDFEQAVKDLGDAITLDPTLAVAYAGRALALTRLERDGEAQQDLEQAVELGIDRANLEERVENLKRQR